MLEEIREKIRRYHFGERHINSSAETHIGGMSHYPVNPTISYRKRNFFEIYKLFCTLQSIVLSRRPIDRDRFIYKIQALFYSGQFRACRKLIRNEGRSFEKDATLYNGYLALCELGLGNMRKFYSTIESTYKVRPYRGSLVSSRGTFKNLLEDNKLMEILAQFYSAEEISALKTSVIKDREHKEAFERSNKALEEYFRAKVSSVTFGANSA